MTDFAAAIEELKVEADAKGVPTDNVDLFREEADAIDAEIKADGKLDVSAQKLGLLGTSLESFTSDFMNCISTENWDVRSARQFDMGIQSILGMVGLEAKAMEYEVSFEAQGVIMSKEEQKGHAEGQADSLIKRVYTMLVNAIKRMVAGAKNFFSSLERMAVAIGKVGGEMQALVKSRQFKTGEVSGAFTRYLHAGDKQLGAVEAITKTEDLIEKITNAWTKDTIVAIKAVAAGGKPKLSAISALGFPISWPGGSVMKLSGDDLSSTKFSVTKGDAPATTTAPALTQAEATSLVNAILSAGGRVRSLRTHLEQGLKDYEAVANSLASAENIKRNVDMAAGSSVSALTGQSNQVNKACASIMLENVKNAVAHIKASFGGNEK